MSRSLEHSIALKAPASLVWKALTEAEGLKAWFATDARVEPGVGGNIWLTFGDASEGMATPIVVWEPNTHLRKESTFGPGMPPFAIDYFIESQGDTTVLRIVTSGFGDDPGWDEMYQGMDAGWNYFILLLKIALERHPGVPRAMAYQRRHVAGTRTEAWSRLQQAMGLTGQTKSGDRITLPLGGDQVAAQLLLIRPGRCLALSIPSLNDGVLMLEQEPGEPKWKLGGYLSMYGVPANIVAAQQAAFSRTLDQLAGPVVEVSRG